MELIAIIFFIYLFFIGLKILFWSWKSIILPTGRLLWKSFFIFSVLVGFSVFFLSRDIGFNSLPREFQITIVLGAGIYTGIKFLKSRGSL